ncbi:MAG: transposase [Candidatus Omnitrophica bacterium]|nr:transposase [Candidatus Omnitrophota bacterium]
MERMDMHSRNQYLKVLLGRYLKADRQAKGLLLDEYCKNTGQNRKYAIRKINELAFTEPKEPRKRQAAYGSDVKDVLSKLWEVFDHPCGQRLKPILGTEVQRLRQMGELDISERLAERLNTISSATIDRLLKSVKDRCRYERKSNHSRSGNLLYRRIPLKLTDWDTKKVGNVEMDLVCHCGASAAGEYINTLSAIEISSGWWEGEATMGKAQQRTFASIEAIRQRMPFDWKGIDSDNDRAFINAHLLKYCQKEGLNFTRSRPNRKNDNAYIEQKNYTHVRRPLGYLRYDTEEELKIINDLYGNELRLYKNFFQPVMKLMKKERIDGRLKRVYDIAKTPYQRLMESGQLSKEQEKSLKKIYRGLNPVKLKNAIDAKLERLYNTYHKKKKGTITVNPYKKLVPSSVTFFMIQQKKLRLPC